jgi:hypothetical protein
MKSADEIKRLFHSAAVQTNAAPDDAVFETLKTAYTRTVEHKSAQRESSMWRFVMRNPSVKLAVAAVVVIACVIGLSLWRTTGSGIALADVLARIEQVKAYRSTTSAQFWSTKVTGEEPNKPYNFKEAHDTWLVSKEYGRKSTDEELDPNGGWSKTGETYCLPAKRTYISIWPKQKRYRRTEFDDRWAEQFEDSPYSPGRLVKRILEYKYESLGRSTIDGIEVEGFRTTDPNHVVDIINRGESEIQADIKIWVDVKTQLPVRWDSTCVLSYQKENTKKYEHFVKHDFQWDVPVAAADFEPVIPEDYTGIVIKYPAHITEETAIEGLKVWGELLGKYPEKSPIEADDADVGDAVLRLAEKSETPAAMRLKEEMKGLTDEQIKNKLVDFLMPIRGLDKFYMTLQWYKKDRAYYGKLVTPKDADKVLMRWKVSDKEYRVIFGDLHTQTVTAEALAKLEKNLSK